MSIDAPQVQVWQTTGYATKYSICSDNSEYAQACVRDQVYMDEIKGWMMVDGLKKTRGEWKCPPPSWLLGIQGFAKPAVQDEGAKAVAATVSSCHHMERYIFGREEAVANGRRELCRVRVPYHGEYL